MDLLCLDDTIEIFDVELVLFEDPIGIKAFYLDNQLYFPVEELSQRLGLPIRIIKIKYTCN